jgi:hypothetical protein
VAVPDERIYVGLIHEGNTSPKNTEHGLWSAHPREAVEELMGDAAALYCRPAAAAIA